MLEVIILAAGRGSRMQSDLPKVLKLLAGRPLISHVLETAGALKAQRVHVVIGYGADKVKSAIGASDVQFHLQDEQLGTCHAVMQAIEHCEPTSTVLVLYGDVPLLGVDSLKQVVLSAATQITMMSAELSDPSGYGRVIRDQAGIFAAVIEERDATPEQRAIKEVNSGVLASPSKQLAGLLSRVTNKNTQAEYCLPDVLRLAREDGCGVSVIRAIAPMDMMGANTPQQLEELERLHQAALAEQLMSGGVTLSDRNRIDIRGRLHCGRDVWIDVNVIFEGEVTLGDGVSVGANCIIRDTKIGAGSKIHPFTHIESSEIGEHAQVGPFARIRTETQIDDRAKVGNFVEVKNSQLGVGAKANHLAYLGDAEIGADTNIGAGTITCNYDGSEKHRTELGEGVFIGSNSTLVAPLTIDAGGFIAAGSTITDDVKADQLAIARGRQRNVDGWQRPAKPKNPP